MLLTAQVNTVTSRFFSPKIAEPSSDSEHRHIRLRIPVTLSLSNGWSKEISAFIDTGSEVSLIKRGLLPDDSMRPAGRPLQLVTASGQVMRGGAREADTSLGLVGRCFDSGRKKKVALQTPTVLLEADMAEDVLLSYQWLGTRHFDIHARDHGIMGHVDGLDVWVAGTPDETDGQGSVQQVSVQAVPHGDEKRALDLFCGRKSAAKALEQFGYRVETLDMDPARDPSICIDVLEWDYTMFPPGHFHIITAAPPCTEYSMAMNRRPRQLNLADSIVRRTLEIIRYLQPDRWWLETPRTGLLAKRDLMNGIPFVDCDYCCFETVGYQKPTRFFGSSHILDLEHRLCDSKNCSSIPKGVFKNGKPVLKHKNPMGGHGARVRKEEAYHIPEQLIWYVSGLLQPPLDSATSAPSTPLTLDEEKELQSMVQQVRLMHLRAIPAVEFVDSNPDEDEKVLELVARKLFAVRHDTRVVNMVTASFTEEEQALANELQTKLFAEFGETSLSGVYLPDPPVRGPYGEGTINLKRDAKPVCKPPFQLTGERREALDTLVAKYVDQGKLEPGSGPWNTPAFPVQKKVPHTFRLVQDLRPQNEATEKDGHPLPRIGDMVHRQGKNQIWSVLDLVDGFHQMPLKREHRFITCMSTPRGTQQWTVVVMGLKNAGIQFQRMMEWVLRDLPASDPYMDDVITGDAGATVPDQLRANYESVRANLATFAREKLVCSGPKSRFFQKTIEFCGHVLTEGRRSPAPGKLLPIQLWELPQTVTELRGFLGLTNYFSEYVEHYAETAAPLMGKLQLNRQDGKKGSKVRLHWTEAEIQAFADLKKKLCKNLELWQPDPDAPFHLHCHASDFAIGAELTQQFGGEWKPVAFFSRKLAKSQRNWTPREKETYAIVASLRKWSGLVGFQPILVTTDHRSIEDWVTEHLDTPSGPRGRRARWHETLSQFDLEIQYIPGPQNVVPDALSRFAYPASSAREDVSFHGSAAASEEVRQMVQRELELGRMVGMIRLRSPTAATAIVGGPLPPDASLAARVCVVTRTGEYAPETDEPESEHAPWLRSTRRRLDKDRPAGLGGGQVDGTPPRSPNAAVPPVPPLPVSSSSQADQGGPRHGPCRGAEAGDAGVALGQCEQQRHRSPDVCPPLREWDGQGDGDIGDGDGGGPQAEGWTEEEYPCAVPWSPCVGVPRSEEEFPEMDGDDRHAGLADLGMPPPSHIDLGFRFATPGQPNSGHRRPLKRLPIVAPPSAPVVGGGLTSGGERGPPMPSRASAAPGASSQAEGGPLEIGSSPFEDTSLNFGSLDETGLADASGPAGQQCNPPSAAGAAHQVSHPLRDGGFRFAEPPPGARPGGVSRLPPARLSRGGRSRLPEDGAAAQAMRAPSHIMDADWSGEYQACPFFAEPWVQTVTGEVDWPRDYKVHRSKMYYQEKLCVPTGLVHEVLRIHHEWVGHVGNDRLLPEVLRRYYLPPSIRVGGVIQDIRRTCLLCQACDKPNFSRRRPLAMTPVPDRFMTSVCLDVFAMPPESWQGQKFDAFLLCVDRHSGWMIARPVQNAGLTGEKACHLMLDSAWGEVGIPSVVTTDLGAQFVSAWWRCMCSRLGIRLAHSQAHRHQGNGRAEVAGRVIQDILRKLCLDSTMNWVEALPRALRVQHDMVDPITGLSPYEILFGRERSLAGLPWEPRLRCPEAEAFFSHMEEVDRRVSELLNEEHAKLARRLNADRSEDTPLQEGDWVWYLRPKSVGGAKLQTYWQGPFKVLEKVGERSYRLRTPQGEEFDAHRDQLKPCVGGGPGPLLCELQYPPVTSAADPDAPSSSSQGGGGAPGGGRLAAG